MKRSNFVNFVNFALVVVVCFFVLKQYGVAALEREVVGDDSLMKMAYEVIDLSDSNSNLLRELERLKERNESFVSNLNDKNSIREELENKIARYKVINGMEVISGRGVEVEVRGDMVTEEIIDLVNGIRNIKPDAIGINGKRIIYKSYFIVDNKMVEVDDNYYDVPFTLQIVGDPDRIESSLNRSGGILDVLRKNSFGKLDFGVLRIDDVQLPAFDKKVLFRNIE